MTDNVYLNKDRTAVVSEFAAGKKWQVPRAEAVRLGLLDSPDKPVQARRAPAFDASAAVAPTDKPKQKRRSAPRKKK
jgi:hypothetical protein